MLACSALAVAFSIGRLTQGNTTLSGAVSHQGSVLDSRSVFHEPGRQPANANAGKPVKVRSVLSATQNGIEHQRHKDGDERLANAESEESKSQSFVADDVDAFVAEFESAVAREDIAAIQSLMRKIPNNPAYAESIMDIVKAGSSEPLRLYAAEALVRIGTPESVSSVLDQGLAALREGDSDLARELSYSLESLSTVEGTRPLLDLLSGTGRYAGLNDTLPDELRAAARKAVRNVTDRKAVGEVAAELYLDLAIAGNDGALLELFEGVAHPNMLAVLAVQSFRSGESENATGFLDRLVRIDDESAVQAIIEAGSAEVGLFDDVAERLYSWSLDHPIQAQPGLYLEYVSNSTRSPNERILGAYGLAGVANRDETVGILAKVLAQEDDPGVRANVASLLDHLKQPIP